MPIIDPKYQCVVTWTEILEDYKNNKFNSAIAIDKLLDAYEEMLMEK